MTETIRRVLRGLAIVTLAFAGGLWLRTLWLWLRGDDRYEPWNALAGAIIATMISAIGWLTARRPLRPRLLFSKRSNVLPNSDEMSGDTSRGRIHASSLLSTDTIASGAKTFRTSNVPSNALDKTIGTDFVEQKLPRMAAPLAASLEPHAAILMIDVDLLTQINNKYGRHCGDEVLLVVAAILAQCRRVKYYGRCGDDTFYVVLTKVTLRIASGVAEKFRLNVHRYPWSSLAPDLRVSCSVGFSMLTFGERPQSWIQRALHGLLESKRLGGNRVVQGPRLPIVPREPGAMHFEPQSHNMLLTVSDTRETVLKRAARVRRPAVVDRAAVEPPAPSSKRRKRQRKTKRPVEIQMPEIDLVRHPVRLREFVS